MKKPCCDACHALLEECGPELWPMYSKKLLLRGWAGQRSAAEKAYCKAHGRKATARQQAALARGRAKLEQAA